MLDGEIVSENRNGVIRDYVPDALGSTVALLDNTQTITDTFSYFPSGTVASRTGTTATPFQFVGTKGYHADSSGKTYVRARVYWNRRRDDGLRRIRLDLTGAIGTFIPTRATARRV